METATEILNSLPQFTKNQLGETWIRHPPVAYTLIQNPSPGDREPQAVAVRIVEWCEKNWPAPDMSTASADLVHVCVRNGKVVKIKDE